MASNSLVLELDVRKGPVLCAALDVLSLGVELAGALPDSQVPAKAELAKKFNLLLRRVSSNIQVTKHASGKAQTSHNDTDRV